MLRGKANPDAYTFNEYQKTQRATDGVTASIRLTADLSFLCLLPAHEVSGGSSVLSIHREFDTPSLTFQINHRSGEKAIKSNLSFGVDCSWQAIDEFKHPNLGNAVEGPELQAKQNIDQTGTGIFLLDRVELGQKWGISGIVRYDYISNRLEDKLQLGGVDLSGKVSFKKATGRVGITWNPVSDFGLYASWGSGFLPPGTEELVNNPYSYGKYNKQLKAATSSGEEIGLRGGLGAFTYDVAVFHLETKNDFGRYRLPSRPLETFYRNVGSTRRYGQETSCSWLPMKELFLSTAYAYYHFKYRTVDTLTGEKLSDTWLPNIPQH